MATYSTNYEINMHTKLQLGSAATTPVFTDIPRLRNIPGLSLEEEKIEVTHNQSNNREFIPNGLQDPGDYEFDMETDRSDTTHQALFALWKSKEVRKFRDLDGTIEELKGVYTCGFNFDADEFKLLISSTDEEAERIIARKVVDSLSYLDRLSKKAAAFDKERFKSDMIQLFKDNNLI